MATRAPAALAVIAAGAAAVLVLWWHSTHGIGLPPRCPRCRAKAAHPALLVAGVARRHIHAESFEF